MQKSAYPRTYKWTAAEWELAWSVAGPRVRDAPEPVQASAAMKRLVTALDRAFAAGDPVTFTETTLHLAAHCETISKAKGIKPWWRATMPD